MTLSNPLKKILLAALLAGAAAAPAVAQVSININLAPPQPQYEVVPVLAPNRVWAPGYWAWNGDRHIWMRGRSISKRDGYRWAPDRWEQRGGSYYRQPGNWVREVQYAPVKAQKFKKDKHDKHDESRGRGHDERRDKGHGKGKDKDKGHGPRH